MEGNSEFNGENNCQENTENQGLRDGGLALAGLRSWLEHHLMHQSVVGSIPGQDTHPGCRFNSWSECVWEATN